MNSNQSITVELKAHQPIFCVPHVADAEIMDYQDSRRVMSLGDLRMCGLNAGNY